MLLGSGGILPLIYKYTTYNLYMKKIFNFTIEESKLEEVRKRSKKKDMSIASYIKSKIFNDEDE